MHLLAACDGKDSSNHLPLDEILQQLGARRGT